MNDRKIIEVTGKAIVINGDDIDTDRIIPARFLKEITFANLGKYPFYDERFNEDSTEKTHPFNHPQNQDCKLLFVNKNFGCGSSREHAPQALKRWGIDAIVGESFAEIFASNCIAIGIPAVTVSASEIKTLQQHTNKHANEIWNLSLATSTVSSADITVNFNMPDHHKRTLQEGLWDGMSLLLENLNEVKTLYNRLPYTNEYRDSSSV